MSLSKSTTLLALAVLSTSAISFAQPQSDAGQKQILCSDTFPERPEICPDIYEPVCAYSPKQCFTTPCPQFDEHPNACSACSDAIVTWYKEGPCEDEDLGGEIAKETLFGEEELSLVENEFGNEEQALEGDYASINCADPRPEVCTFIYDPVCVTECADGPCKYTAGNGCSACSDANVLAYTPQSCEEERVQCAIPDLSATDINCIDLWDPVCAYSLSDNAGKTLSNDCYACYFNGADYYIKGECPGSNSGNGPVV